MRRLIWAATLLLSIAPAWAQEAFKDYADPDGAFAVRQPASWAANRERVPDVGWLTQISPEANSPTKLLILTVTSDQEIAPERLNEVGQLLFGLVIASINEEGRVLSQKVGPGKLAGKEALRCDLTFRTPEAPGPQRGYMLVALGKRSAVLAGISAPQTDDAGFKRLENLLATFAVESRTPGAAGGSSVLSAASLARAAQRVKAGFARETDAVLVDGDPPLTMDSVMGFVDLLNYTFDISLTEAEVELTRQRFIEHYKKQDPTGREMIARGGRRLLDQAKSGTPEEQAAKKKEACAVLTDRLSNGAKLGIDWAVVLYDAVQRRGKQVVVSTAPAPKFAQEGKLKAALTEADLDASMEMLYFMWVAAGRDPSHATPEAILTIRAYLAQSFRLLPADVQYLFANAETIYGRMRTAWAQSGLAERAAIAGQFGQALDQMGLTVPQQGGGSAWDDVAGKDPSSLRAELVQTTCWNLAQKATR